MRIFLYSLLLAFFLTGCSTQENPLAKSSKSQEILVYSGITMADAVFELVSLFEIENDCSVSVLYGASGYLKNVVDVNRKGDIFFPGNISYLADFKKSYVITREEDVGYNKLSFFVKKNNPMQLTGDLDELLKRNLKVTIGSSDAGSVGKETIQLLKQHGIYDTMVTKVISFATDSKGLSAAIKNGEADIVINWLASGMTNRNAPFMTPLEIKSEHVRKVPIAMGLLKYSIDTRCANKFLDLASSERGHQIFAKYGFAEK